MTYTIEELLEKYEITQAELGRGVDETRQVIRARKLAGWTVNISGSNLTFTNPKKPADRRIYNMRGVAWFKKKK